MKTFPMFLTMQGRRVVIAGGGEQAAQKCRLMLKTEARICLLADRLDPELEALHRAGRVEWHAGPVSAAQFADAALVFIATGSGTADACLHTLAKAVGALVNVVDRPDLCDAITPSIVDRDPVVVAIGTEGTAPVLARQIKTRVEQMLEPRLGDLAAVAGRLRDLAAHRLAPRARRDLWRWVFDGPVRVRHARGGERAAAGMIKDAIMAGTLPDAAPAAVALVGAGPGSKDLITLRGVQRLQEADVIFYDRLVDPEVLELARRDAERVYVGKAPGAHSMTQSQINGLIVAAARQGKRVVRLKCGDPGVFARGADEAAALAEAGIPCEIVPGVTAASAAAAGTGSFLTERGAIDTLVLTTARNETADDRPNWPSQLHPGVRVAVYMGVSEAPRIQAMLETHPWRDAISIEIVANAQMPDQRSLRCGVADMAQALADNGIRNTAIIFVTVRKDAVQARPALRVVEALA